MQATVRIKLPTARDDRWLRLAEQGRETGGALSHDSSLVATYPVEYGKRAGELIARGARSLHQSLIQRETEKRKAQARAEVSVNTARERNVPTKSLMRLMHEDQHAAQWRER
jgi:hypothetical protein